MAKWQQKFRMDWDAAGGRNGGAQQTVWEILMEMERLNGKAKEEDQGAAGPCEGFWASQLSCGLGLGDALLLPKKDVAGALRLL